MANFAWVIDQTSCIGCHACTTACKSENEVPLGVNRTWVKYVETGAFPATRRQIAVLRCNHCAEPPCVEVCPTRAMFQRADGIVDFDTERCIGCKACLQACPYDAIYIDPEEHVAEKCNFCAHRVDRGLLPACVVVCPTESLVFGDLDDPASRAHHLLSSRPTTVRRAEQGTSPKAFYLGASEVTLDPLAPIHQDTYMWAERRTGGSKDYSEAIAARRALPVISLGTSGGPRPDAPAVERPMPAARVAYDVFHPRPWGWKVALYLWTKGIGAGAFALVFLAMTLGLASVSREIGLLAAFVSLAGVGATSLLLVWDLKRPERFWTILVRPQPRSWLAIGAFVLVGYSGLLGLWFLGTWFDVDVGLLTILGWPTTVLAVLTALYSAFLLGQCEARDLWQNPVVAVVLIAQATILGAACLLGAAALLSAPRDVVDVGRVALLVGALVNGAALVVGEALVQHPTTNARAAAQLLVGGPFRGQFWIGGVSLAGLVPIVVVVVAPATVAALALAGLVAAAGLLWYELGFIAAGQAVPIS